MPAKLIRSVFLRPVAHVTQSPLDVIPRRPSALRIPVTSPSLPPVLYRPHAALTTVQPPPAGRPTANPTSPPRSRVPRLW
ncbi:hypothetical protein BDN67DRAFT_514783 [Paxillus ammoniavirescens]|nr:hypothetical protein BDN67DRAFT_514783 [Paxillus ammoniavirescens]